MNINDLYHLAAVLAKSATDGVKKLSGEHVQVVVVVRSVEGETVAAWNTTLLPRGTVIDLLRILANRLEHSGAPRIVGSRDGATEN